jgi:UDP-N-acetyl-D-mannosaminuronic acid dehydrogenase
LTGDPVAPIAYCVVGGCGHVGLPLAMAFARKGIQTTSFDINPVAVALVNSGQMPFDEPQAPEILSEILAAGTFRASTDPAVVTAADVVIVVVGTPVDEHLNPDTQAVPDAISALGPNLRDGQLLVLRSTVYPGVTRLVEERIADLGLDIEVAFCPERIAEGKAFTELYSLPQIVSGRTPAAVRRASEVFGNLTDQIVETSPEEAELAKLFTNTWRYIKFAAANQFYMIANSHGIDYEAVRHAITFDYPRAKDLPGAGFAAGPCLFKDTMQLAAFNNNTFFLGHAAMMVNEGLPMYLVERMDERFGLRNKTVGILGMAFKAESDDVRSSLSYKLKRILKFRSREVLCADPYVTTDKSLVEQDELLSRADILIIGAPHPQYMTLVTDRPIVDVWNCRDAGVLL